MPKFNCGEEDLVFLKAQMQQVLRTVTDSYLRLFTEAPEPLYLHIGGTTQHCVDSAKALTENLLLHVRQDYATHWYETSPHHPHIDDRS